MELILAAGIGATATIAGAFMTTRPTNKPKRPVPRKERKRRQVWLAVTSVLVAAALVLAALPTGLVNGSAPIWAIAPLTALLLSYGAPIRVRWALPATLAMLVATTAAPPLSSLARHESLEPYLGIASIATTVAIALATLILVATINKLRCA